MRRIAALPVRRRVIQGRESRIIVDKVGGKAMVCAQRPVFGSFFGQSRKNRVSSQYQTV